jgi:hypothetical protein
VHDLDRRIGRFHVRLGQRAPAAGRAHCRRQRWRSIAC